MDERGSDLADVAWQPHFDRHGFARDPPRRSG
jgi:hypothetical protein